MKRINAGRGRAFVFTVVARGVFMLLMLKPMEGEAVATSRLDAPVESAIEGVAILREAWEKIQADFLDPNFNGVDWPAMLEKYEPQAEKVLNRDELARVVNAMLAELRTSHTSFYTQDDREYYELLDVFNYRGSSELIKQVIQNGKVVYEGIGVVTTPIGAEGKVFIKDVIEGLPAHEAGLKVGDQIISVHEQPFHPIRSFRGKAGQKLKVIVQRTEDESSRIEAMVSPQRIEPHAMFLESIKSSARVIERGDKKIAYVRIRSYASEEFQFALRLLVTGKGQLADADALVLDIRGGWGGANPEYLDLFNHRVPTMTGTDRDGKEHKIDSHWKKPVVLLVDGGSRSGKEVLAQGFKTYGIGPIVGTRTAGAVVGGAPFFLSDGSLLFLAVTNVLIDGERLEGKGVEPDVVVEFPLEYAAGRDPQVEKAIEVAVGETQKASEK